MVELEERRKVFGAEGTVEDPKAEVPPGNPTVPHRSFDPSSSLNKDNTGENRPPITQRNSFRRRHPFLIILALLVAIGALAGGYIWWSDYSAYETTDDAFIDARFFTVSPQVAGYIRDIPVTDNEEVKAGDTLAVIDDRIYKAVLASAEAQLGQAEAAIPNIDSQIAAQRAQITQAQAQIDDADAALKFAGQQNNRAQDLKRTGAGTVQNAQQTQSQLLQAQATADRAKAALIAAQKQLAALQAQRVSAEASIKQARAVRNQAQLNVDYTIVKADQAGRVTELTAAKGQYVQAGQSLMVIVPQPVWVTANFRETQISYMHPGQPVDIDVDAYPNQTFRGHVDSIQSGSGTAFSLLPAENATGNFVKVVQRVPVKIDFDKMPDVVLGPGMSVEPWVRLK